MGIIEDRRRQLEETAQRNRAGKVEGISQESIDASLKCLGKSGLEPLLKLLLPNTSYYGSSRDRELGWESGAAEVSPVKTFHTNYPPDSLGGVAGVEIHVELGPLVGGRGDFDLKFYPDGKIVVDAGPKGSRTISVSDLSRDPKLGEKVLEDAYNNPHPYEYKFLEPDNNDYLSSGRS